MKQRVFENKSFDHCYGCTACDQVCPFDAIKMVENEEGFLYPKIDQKKCTECNLCLRSCPTQEEILRPFFNSIPNIVYAAWNKNRGELLESTSGGIFYLLGKKWIEEGGVVVGASYDDNLYVYHKIVENLEDLKLLRGSKYVQSFQDNCFKQTKELLNQGRKVMYSGTPCQIGGLKTFLKKDYPNLLTIDLVCHGVPSQKIFQEHKHWLETKFKSRLINFKFRGKKKSGWRAYATYIFENGKRKFVFLGKDKFCFSFYKGWMNRLSCFKCEFSQGKRVGDITLSDFWGAERKIKVLKRERKYGFNLVMCNTHKGRSLFENIKDEIEIIEAPFSVAQAGDIRLRETEIKPVERIGTYDILYEKGYSYLIKEWNNGGSIVSKLIPVFVKNMIKEIQSRV